MGRSDSASHAGTCSVSVELLEYVQEQHGGPTESVSEAPGAFGAAVAVTPLGLLHMRPPHMAESWGGRGSAAQGPSHTGLPPNLHPMVRPFVSSGSAPGTGLQACYGLHGCLHHRLGGHVQRACSVGGLDGSPTALAHQLPRVTDSTPGLELSQEALTRQARTGPHG